MTLYISRSTWRHALLLAVAGSASTVGHAAPAAPGTPMAAHAPRAPAPAIVDGAGRAPPTAPQHHGAEALADDTELDAARGGSGVTTIDTRLAGQVTGNTANNVQTGWNVIDGGAFANMTGIPIVVQNSGANVLIQNATVIQLQLQ